MKLHLPISLLAALVCAMNVAAEGAGTIQMGEGQYTYTDDGSTISSVVTGDCTGGYFGTPQEGIRDDMSGWVLGIPVADPDRYTKNTQITIGDGVTETKVNRVVGAGVTGYACDGNITINVEKNATITGTLYAAYNHNTGHNGGLGVDGAESYYNNGKYFGPKSNPASDAVITVNLNGGTINYLYGSSSQGSTRVMTELAYAAKHFMESDPSLSAAEAIAKAEEYSRNSPAYALNQKQVININSGEVTEHINAGGFGGMSIDNTSEININGGTIKGTVYTGGGTRYQYTIDANDANIPEALRGQKVTSTSYVRDTRVTISGDAKVGRYLYGGGQEGSLVKEGTLVTIAGGSVGLSVYGGGYKSTVQGGTEICLSAGTVEENVYGGGNADTVYGGTKVIIKGQGTEVAGGIFGDGRYGSVVYGDRTLGFEASAYSSLAAAAAAYKDENGVSKFHNFNALEIKNTAMELGSNLAEVSETLGGATNGMAIAKVTVTGNGRAAIGALDKGTWVTDAGSVTTADYVSVQAGDKLELTGQGDYVVAGQSAEAQSKSFMVAGEAVIDGATVTMTPGNSHVWVGEPNNSGSDAGKLTIQNGGTLITDALTLNGGTLTLSGGELITGSAITMRGESVLNVGAGAVLTFYIDAVGEPVSSHTPSSADAIPLALTSGTGPALNIHEQASVNLIFSEDLINEVLAGGEGTTRTYTVDLSDMIVGEGGVSIVTPEDNINYKVGIVGGANGAYAAITDVTVNADGSHTFTVKHVPEPATATLSLLALAGLCARRRRR